MCRSLTSTDEQVDADGRRHVGSGHVARRAPRSSAHWSCRATKAQRLQPKGSARAREVDCGNPGSLVALVAPPAAPPGASPLPAREVGSGRSSCWAPWRPSGMEENCQVSVASSIYSINVSVHGNNEVGREIEHNLVCNIALCIVFHSVTNYFPAVS